MVFTKKDGIFMGYVSFREGTENDALELLAHAFDPFRALWLK